MRIIVCTGLSEPPWSSNQGIVQGLRENGHDVWVVGPRYGACNLQPDCELGDRAYPEKYLYQEVLATSPWEQLPDLILQVEPHFYLEGPKPKGVKSAYLLFDAHTGGLMAEEAVRWGQFDVFLFAQPGYADCFLPSRTPTYAYTLPQAVDLRRFVRPVPSPDCDISFVGNTGLVLPEWKVENGMKYDRNGLAYFGHVHSLVPPGIEKYKNRHLPSFDYAERAELIYRLSQDFDLRVYAPIFDDRLPLALGAGRVGFNRSLLNDIGVRVFETAAVGRTLVCDRVSLPFYLEGATRRSSTLLYPVSTSLYDEPGYRPFYPNFQLTYDIARRRVERAIYEWAEGARGASDVKAHHTWAKRAEDLVKLVG